MKFRILLTAMVLTGFWATAQEENNQEIRTLFSNNGKQTVGGYGGLSTGYGQINKLDAIFFGGEGAVIINHSIALGLGGHGFMTETVNDANLGEAYEFAGGYGGLIIEPIIGARNPVHVTFPMLIGAGGIGYVKHWADYNDNYDYENYDEDSDAFFVFEPGVELEFNLVKFMRIAITGSYRFTSNVDLKYRDTVLNPSYENTSIAPGDLLRGYKIGMTMKFGKF
jgi:hypothetical protein